MNEISFDGRVVLVTGSGRGLGAVYARAFGARGASVVVHDAGVEADGSGGDRAYADAVVGEIEAAGGAAAACYENLEPEQVAPGVLFLASERCNLTGKVLEAAGGEFDVARWTSSEGLDFGREPVGPERIAERWAEIEGVTRAA